MGGTTRRGSEWHWKQGCGQGQKAPVWPCGDSRPPTTRALPQSLWEEQQALGPGNGPVSRGWRRLGGKPGLTRFPAPSAPGRDSCPPRCQGQGGAPVTHHSHGNRVGPVAFLMTQGGCARSSQECPNASCHLPAPWGKLARGCWGRRELAKLSRGGEGDPQGPTPGKGLQVRFLNGSNYCVGSGVVPGEPAPLPGVPKDPSGLHPCT